MEYVGYILFIIMVILCIWQSQCDEKKHNEQMKNMKDELNKEHQHEKELLKSIHEREKQELIDKYEKKIKALKKQKYKKED